MHCLCLWHLVLHFQSAEEALGKIPAWLPLQTGDISPQALEEYSRLWKTKTNDKVDWGLIRSLSITASINVSPQCVINLRLSAFAVLLPNTELNISFRVLQTVRSCSALKFFHIIYTTLLFENPSLTLPAANIHSQLLLEQHPYFCVCCIYFPSLQNVGIFYLYSSCV